jgi:hypothetical protein
MPGKHVYGKLYRGFESPSLREYSQKTRVNFALARVLFLGVPSWRLFELRLCEFHPIVSGDISVGIMIRS